MNVLGREAVYDRMMRIVAMLVAVALGGCASQEREYIIGDQRFTATERVSIEAGRTRIMAGTGGDVPEIQWERLPNTDDDMTITKVDLPEGTAGDAPIGSFAVRIDTNQTPAEQLSDVAAHEFGHALGLPHLTEGAHGIMQPHNVFGMSWTADDEASCVHVGVCVR